MVNVSDMLILDQIYYEEKKPYGIIKGIIEKFDERYKPSTGMIYPSLRRLQRENYIIKMESGYKITDKGKEYFNKNFDEYTRFSINYVQNHSFFKTLRKEMKDLFNELVKANSEYIKENQESIIADIENLKKRIVMENGEYNRD
ncbi:PadR family transcriptional regulator [Picrophilus oshimae]|uniref:Hypothetical transcriptional regulatory protein n=1 Tax=Picrophilus torridus (strain ATCC 700027 / DSM 9790 / JCM 10055 / NBRC 100828 / KAW 2/3) TaxID=1122961 RepID=Q6L022_PICTO|nr:PadR family transcriptional regulator [Picrophilus oshimae]AAT43680.1 hypothetical transcriptional regulatory protein [Picrophilus oshimae DSM 9789]